MAITILDKIFVPERHRRYASREGGFVTPALNERPVGPDDGPFLVTNGRCQFLPTQRNSKNGTVRSGFSDCPLEAEDLVIQALYNTLWGHSVAQGWRNRSKSISSGMTQMQETGYEPKALIVSHALLKEACGGQDLSEEDVRTLMLTKGFLAEVHEVRAFMCPLLKPGTAIIAASPTFVGGYARVGHSLSISLQLADRSVILVGEDGVA